MNQQAQETWSRLKTFEVDDLAGGPTEQPFAARLAEENGWPRHFAERVVHEYKRFLLLACHAGHPVTPSDAVDQAWHLHLTYTRSYWERLCGSVLLRELHHDPTRGGEAEAGKFDDWYTRTIDSYLRLFESPPPPDIWPAASVRFSRSQRWRRVNTARVWMVPRRSARPLIATAAAGVGVLAVGGLGGWAPLVAAMPTSRVLALSAAGLAIIAAVTVAICSSRRQRGRDGAGGGGCGGFWGHSADDRHCDSDGGGSDSGCGGGGCGGGGD